MKFILDAQNMRDFTPQQEKIFDKYSVKFERAKGLISLATVKFDTLENLVAFSKELDCPLQICGTENTIKIYQGYGD